jgi:hypothetical protein
MAIKQIATIAVMVSDENKAKSGITVNWALK